LLFNSQVYTITTMNKRIVFAAACVFLSLQGLAIAGHALTGGARYHMLHSEYVELPFDEGDLSYLLGYEYHEGSAFWQLLVGYAPDISEGDDGRGIGVNSVITPQINLIFEDRNFLGGVGVLASYIEMEDEVDLESDWTDVYWQLMLGYQIPLPAFQVEIMAYYPYEKWELLSDFDFGDIEYGLQFKRRF